MLPPDEQLAAGRLLLQRMTDADVTAMSAWLEEALAPEWTLEELEQATSDGHGTLILDKDADRVGAAVVLDRFPVADAWTLAFLAIEPSRRFQGLGGEAALALEAHLRAKRGGRDVFVPVPEGRGLALYFWLRLGFRPLTSAESPGPVTGLAARRLPGIWMLRSAGGDEAWRQDHRSSAIMQP